MQHLNNNAIELLEARYLLRDNTGKIIETPEDLFRRVAKEAASAEEIKNNGLKKDYWEEQFFEIMSGLYFLPNSPALMNSGTSVNQLSACFVLPLENNFDSIFKTLKETVIIQQANGGTGFNFSALYSNENFTNAENRLSLGPLDTLELFDLVIEKLKKNAVRAGANMGVLNIDHPAIEDFIRSKKDENKLQNFNLSIGIYDDFMKAVEEEKNWELKNTITDQFVKNTKAHKLWNQIVLNSWQTGDPGLLFLDEIERRNPLPGLGKINCTNPCGEVPLLPNEACNLGSINLAKFIKKNTEGVQTINWDKISQTIITATRLLDNIITRSDYLLPEIKNKVYSNRKIGLGVMGWAEMLLILDIPYRSEKAIELAENIMQFININAHRASKLLAKEKGVFPNWEKSIYYKKYPLRNATCTSIAPTGSIAIIAGTTPSIEPLFALAYRREGVLRNKTLIEINPTLLMKLEENKLNSKDLLDEIKETGKMPSHKLIPSHIKEIFLTATEIDWLTHLRHQSAFQKNTDNAVSKTINLPENASKKDVDNAFKSAWKLKLKGITIFRQGSRKKQVINAGIKIEDESLCNGTICSD